MSRSKNSRRGVQKTYPGVCRTECRVCQNFDRRVELTAPLAMTEGEEEAAYDWYDRWYMSERSPSEFRTHLPMAPRPLRVPLAWSIESHVAGALQDRIHPTSGRLIKATPLRLPRSRA